MGEEATGDLAKVQVTDLGGKWRSEQQRGGVRLDEVDGQSGGEK